jgi:DNA adenine methylase
MSKNKQRTAFVQGEKIIKKEIKSEDKQVKYYVPIEKLNEEKQILVGVVLQPEIVDAQGDIISKNVIEEAAHKFLSSYNRTTKLGLMHKNFDPKFSLYESYITPIELAIGSRVVKAGSWIVSVHVRDKEIWKKIKDKELNGLSIGGVAKVKRTA